MYEKVLTMKILRQFFMNKVVKNIRTYINYLPTQRLENKVAVITSSTSGVGLATAIRLGLEGAKVSISSRNQSNVDKAIDALKQSHITTKGMVCDIGKADEREKLFKTVNEEFGGIDILVVNTGSSPFGRIVDCDDNEWNEIFNVNLKYAYFLAKEALPYLMKKKNGKIVFMTSIAAYHPLNLIGIYSIAKTAVIGLTKMLARELADKNINVNAIAPGLINTKFSEPLREGDVGKKHMEKILLKRYGTADDIAASVAFLVSGDANYVTGEVIVVAGGMMSRL